ncbi:MAG: hypothetical protein H6Q90_2964 [Deltaproteobacteria bacterium]|nr:hypothetical protein [Deltaproteobacteria bacterium]
MLRKLSFGLFIAALAACGSARVISRTQAGGVIELQGDRGKAMEEANSNMNAHCGPGNFTITQEGEEAIGTDTVAREDTSEDTAHSRSGRRSSTDSTTVAQTSTRTATAWRVHYACNGAGAGAPPPPPPAAAVPPPPAGPPAGAPPPGY